MSAQHCDVLYDVAGVGLGPFNLGAAALMENVPDIKAVFIEEKTEFDWHPGMLLDGTTLQVPFLADLVSMADVTNRFSFLNYLQEHGRMYHFYFLEKFHIPRQEYNHYCRWAASHITSCQFGMRVQEVRRIKLSDCDPVYEITVRNENINKRFYARHLLMGVGTTPAVPGHLQHALGDTVFHTSEYLYKKESCENADSIAVIGSGQSSAEVFLELAHEQVKKGFSLHWFTRSMGFFPMEYSKLGLEHFSPDYTAFFYQLPQFKKDRLLEQQHLLYKGISADTIAAIYDLLYERSIGNTKPDIHLQAMTEVENITKRMNQWELQAHHHIKGDSFKLDADVIILGTGYAQTMPHWLSPVDHLIERDERGRFQITEDYRLVMRERLSNEIFVQNAELHTHGVGAPDLGLGAHRNAVIINQLVGREAYPVQSDAVFQTFGIEQPTMSSTHI
ncbi:lysine N(6)-hydroxylase/L-ornithine N(5)-oxygenase family protein [Thalassobacillus sp. CUG 92003]|uniref:lysine N(6)-hydroxylase/L-ornithine N(5)-oxygenase family protein n=1 Tax=Thalassobacillus sp. CUG 92003 TaxID=2736641 RepID=UPI0015E7D236|nr:lysine N(6)-hydroxylase/L-ornithine N(5)-oxygenase family protein [Thalassobacillus sp. CUG 92003]